MEATKMPSVPTASAKSSFPLLSSYVMARLPAVTVQMRLQLSAQTAKKTNFAATLINLDPSRNVSPDPTLVTVLLIATTELTRRGTSAWLGHLRLGRGEQTADAGESRHQRLPS